MRFPVRNTSPLIVCAFALASAEESFTIGAQVSPELHGEPVQQTFAVDTVDRYGSNWRGLQIPLETAREYETIDPFFLVFLDGRYKDFEVRFNLPLRKDLEAWYEDDLHSNTTIDPGDRKSTRLNSSHQIISYAVFCLKK